MKNDTISILKDLWLALAVPAIAFGTTCIHELLITPYQQGDLPIAATFAIQTLLVLVLVLLMFSVFAGAKAPSRQTPPALFVGLAICVVILFSRGYLPYVFGTDLSMMFMAMAYLVAIIVAAVNRKK